MSITVKGYGPFYWAWLADPEQVAAETGMRLLGLRVNDKGGQWTASITLSDRSGESFYVASAAEHPHDALQQLAVVLGKKDWRDVLRRSRW